MHHIFIPLCRLWQGRLGYLDAILYAGLVTGFNTKTITSISVASNLATVTTSTAHNYNKNDVIKIEGANESIFNDEFRILSIPSTTTFTFSLVTEITSATGSMTAKIAPLGWERVYTGTNISVYRSLEGNRFYLRVDDTNATYTTVTMYESMTNVNTGVNPVGPVYWMKSNAASTASREWYLIGNKKTFYLFVAFNSSYLTMNQGYVFGEFNSIKPDEQYNTLLMGYSSSSPSGMIGSNSFTQVSSSSATSRSMVDSTKY